MKKQTDLVPGSAPAKPDRAVVDSVKRCCDIAAYRSLTLRGKAAFRQACSDVLRMGLPLADPDLRQLAVYARSWDLYLALDEDIRKNGAVVVTHTVAGVRRFPNPAVKMQRDALCDLMSISRNFGFSPLDRRRLKKELSQERDPLGEFLAKNGIADEQ